MKRPLYVLCLTLLWFLGTAIDGCHEASLEKIDSPIAPAITPPPPIVACTLEDATHEYGKGTCCEGLAELALMLRPQDDSSCPQLIDYTSEEMVCAACGNYICNLGENKCNCPQDCLKVCSSPNEPGCVIPPPPPVASCLREHEQKEILFSDGTISREEMRKLCCEGLSPYITDATSLSVYVECRLPDTTKTCIDEFYLYDYPPNGKGYPCCEGLQPTLLTQRVTAQDGIHACPAIVVEIFPPPVAETCLSVDDGACNLPENDCNSPNDCLSQKEENTN